MILLAEDDYNFLPDGRALSRRTTNTVAINADYVWLDNLPVAQFQDSYDSQGTYQGTTVTYLHADHLGTPRLGTNGSQQVTWRYESDAFGIATLSGTAVVGLRFPGQQSLGIAGLNYNYYRDYVPDRGRYLESDPIGLRGGLNTYGYVSANPLRFSDPLGLLDRLEFDGKNLIGYEDFGEEFRLPAVSGPYGLGTLPEGLYVGRHLRVRKNKPEMSCSNETPFSLDLDPTFQTTRTLLRIHPDANPIGTLGCIGVKCGHAQTAYGSPEMSYVPWEVQFTPYRPLCVSA